MDKSQESANILGFYKTRCKNCNTVFTTAFEMVFHSKKCNIIMEKEREKTWWSCNLCLTNIGENFRCLFHPKPQEEYCEDCDRNLSSTHKKFCKAKKKN